MQPFAGVQTAEGDAVAEKLEDVTARLCEHIVSVYQENAPSASTS